MAEAAVAPHEPAPVVAAGNLCSGCGETYPSRNALFRHVREHGCGGGARRRVEKLVLTYGYVGTGFHGSQRNSLDDEARCPTVEGTLLAAMEAAAQGQKSVASVSTEVCSRASRTDRGVHAFANVVCLKMQLDFHPGIREMSGAL